MKVLAALVLSVTVMGARAQGALVYAFSGRLPTSVPQFHSSVSAGESWVAAFLIDSVADVVHPEFTEYPSAVLSGTLAFSGGYVAPFDFAGFNVQVFRNSEFHAVSVYGTVNGHGIMFQALSDLKPLPSSELPQAGMGLEPSPKPATAASFVQLIYADSLGDVLHTSRDANNVSFVAGVPEPAAILQGCVAALSLCARRRRIN